MSVTDRGSGWLSEVSENDVYADAASHLVSVKITGDNPPSSTLDPDYLSCRTLRAGRSPAFASARAAARRLRLGATGDQRVVDREVVAAILTAGMLPTLEIPLSG